MSNKIKLAMTFLSRSFDVFGAETLKPKVTTTLLATAVLLSLTACGGAKWHETRGQAPVAGPMVVEQKPIIVAPPVKTGDVVTVTPEEITDESSEEIPENLGRHDELHVIDANPVGADGSVEAVIVNTEVPELKGKIVLVPKKAVVVKAKKKTVVKPAPAKPVQPDLIQNRPSEQNGPAEQNRPAAQTTPTKKTPAKAKVVKSKVTPPRVIK